MKQPFRFWGLGKDIVSNGASLKSEKINMGTVPVLLASVLKLAPFGSAPLSLLYSSLQMSPCKVILMYNLTNGGVSCIQPI